nr:hypothetical protein [Tanacetum cinerariifolium]
MNASSENNGFDTTPFLVVLQYIPRFIVDKCNPPSFGFLPLNLAFPFLMGDDSDCEACVGECGGLHIEVGKRALDFETNGRNIKNNGQDIEKNGQDIENNIPGIEKNDWGIERNGHMTVLRVMGSLN